MRLFISYKRDVEPDQTLALTLEKALREHHEVFIDRGLHVGVDWARAIQTELERTDALISLLSAESVQSEMVLGEIMEARRLAKLRGGRPRILPIRVVYREPFQYPLNAYFSHINWADWHDTSDNATLVEALLQALQVGDLAARPAAEGGVEARDTMDIVPPPPPAADPTALEAPGGTVQPGSRFYVARQSDEIALRHIQRDGGVTLTITGARQMGKSSLLVRLCETAATLGKHVVLLDFQRFDAPARTPADEFFRGFCASIADELNLDTRVDELWPVPSLGNVQRTTRFLARHVLRTLDGPVVFAFDEVDTVTSAAFSNDFFAMLRSWHNERYRSAWKRVDLVLVISSEPYHLIGAPHMSPFNVAETVRLEDFGQHEIATLNELHGSPLTHAQVEKLAVLLGGHPYLVRRALYLLATRRHSVTRLFADAAEGDGPFGDHLRYHLFRLLENHRLVSALRDVVHGERCDDEMAAYSLQGAGLIRRAGRRLVPRCQVYADYFRIHLA